MTVMPRIPAPLTDTIPPRPITIHRGDVANISFDGFGTVSVSGPRRAELAGMVAALPIILRELASVTAMLRDRDGSTSPFVATLEGALAEAGIPNNAQHEEPLPMTSIPPSTPAERLAEMLRTTADTLVEMADDRANFRAPRSLKDALRNLADTIRAVLRENAPQA